MEKIKFNKRLLKDCYGDPDKEIGTCTKEIVSANILEVEAGTTDYKGGDSGHGCRSYFRIKDLASTDMRVNSSNDSIHGSYVEVTLGGDTELYTMIEALRFIADVLDNGETTKESIKTIGK